MAEPAPTPFATLLASLGTRVLPRRPRASGVRVPSAPSPHHKPPTQRLSGTSSWKLDRRSPDCIRRRIFSGGLLSMHRLTLGVVFLVAIAVAARSSRSGQENEGRSQSQTLCSRIYCLGICLSGEHRPWAVVNHSCCRKLSFSKSPSSPLHAGRSEQDKEARRRRRKAGSEGARGTRARAAAALFCFFQSKTKKGPQQQQGARQARRSAAAARDKIAADARVRHERGERAAHVR